MTYGRTDYIDIHMKKRSTNPTHQHPFPERKPLRLSDYDYTQAGACFVTICTQNRSCLFGTIVDGEMLLNEIGQIVEEQLHAIPKRFPQAGLDEYMVMPNHRSPLFICSEAQLLRWAVLEILMYHVYTPVSALRPPCSWASHDNK
jgi:hypothetical protein